MKKTSTFQNALIWFGAGVSLAEILTGTAFAPLGMGKGLLAILIGHVIGCGMGIYAAEPIADILASATTLTLFLSQRKKLLPTEKDAPKG